MIAQSTENLQNHLKEQINFLKKSAKLYDEGDFSEAKRLAVTLRVLLHDTSTSKSLLDQLHRKNQTFPDTASERPRGVVTSYTGLVGATLGAGPSEFVPNLDFGPPPHQTPFDNWWNSPIIIDLKQREITRKKLVLYVSNQDGGAHIDPEIDEIYANLSRANSLGRIHNTTGNWEPIFGVEHASIRQIAHEVLKLLDASFRPSPTPRPPHLVIGGLVELGFAPNSQTKPITKVGRNEPCPCGSGKKYKECHG